MKRLLPEFRDVLAIASLVSIGYGLFLVYPPAMYIGIGAIVFLLCVYGA